MSSSRTVLETRCKLQLLQQLWLTDDNTHGITGGLHHSGGNILLVKIIEEPRICWLATSWYSHLLDELDSFQDLHSRSHASFTGRLTDRGHQALLLDILPFQHHAWHDRSRYSLAFCHWNVCLACLPVVDSSSLDGLTRRE